ncbi:MFS transporter [Breznakiella homolactica]|uniref:MFS transporter n=1 Tax=Breznakiella homolactica TaxID=2798577 RepID=A0A7T8B9R2_9SPIR|nr:MFS transporter [Breznakiella homolactica]QQO08747.1 MFS transporter [Breznakiella homolactica]
MNTAAGSAWQSRLAYSAINFGFSLLGMTVSMLLMYYYTDVLLLPAAAVSGILFSARLFDGVIDPFLGHYMDRRTTRFGKYRGYILYWAVPMCAAFVLMFAAVPFGGTARILWCLLVYLGFTLCFSFVETSSLPMLSSFGSRKNRSACNTWKIAGCIIATLVVSISALKLVRILGSGSEQTGYFRMAVLFAAVVLAALILGGRKLREGTYAVSTESRPGDGFSGCRAIALALREKPIVFLLCMYLCIDAATAFKIQAGIYYLKYNINRQDLTSLFLTSSIAMSLLVQPLVLYLSGRVSSWILMAGGSIVSALAMVGIGFSGNSPVLLIGANCIFGMASAFPVNLAFSSMADMSEALSAKHGKSFGGVVNSFLGVASRIGSSSASALLAIILSVTAYSPNTVQTSKTLLGISIGFTVIPVFVLLLSGLFAILSMYSFEGKDSKRPVLPQHLSGTAQEAESSL